MGAPLPTVHYLKKSKYEEVNGLEEELEAFLKLVSLQQKEEIFDLTFYLCTLGDKELVLVQSGIGKVNAARSTQVLIDHMDVEAVFFVDN